MVNNSQENVRSMSAALIHPFAAIASLFDRSFDPATARKLPVRNESGESSVAGLYLAGEIAGTPLIKLGLNRGRSIIDHIVNVDLKAELGPRLASIDDDGTLTSESTGWDRHDSRDGDWLDVLIVGAGSAGLGAADRCQQLGLNYVVIEGQRTAQLIRDMTKNKPLYMEPPNEDNQTRLFCEECPKEQLLEAWERQIVELGIAPHIREYETVQDIQRLGEKDGFKVTTNKGDFHARRVVPIRGRLRLSD